LGGKQKNVRTGKKVGDQDDWWKLNLSAW
jgi:hypothetical protein